MKTFFRKGIPELEVDSHEITMSYGQAALTSPRIKVMETPLTIYELQIT